MAETSRHLRITGHHSRKWNLRRAFVEKRKKFLLYAVCFVRVPGRHAATKDHPLAGGLSIFGDVGRP